MINRLKKHVDHAQAEAGQAIVFVALFMILLVAMLGLAIDGGGLFFEWRSAQNAADSAVLAAAYSKCSGDTVDQAKQRGLTVAAGNGYDDGNEWQTKADADFDQENPDVRVFFGDSGQTGNITLRDGSTQAENAYVASQLPSGVDPDDFILVDIYVEKPAYFIQVVYPFPLIVSPRAIAACDPGFDASTMPGGFAYGDCGGSTKSTINWSGSRSYYEGRMHSNGGVTFTGGVVFNGSLITYDTSEGNITGEARTKDGSPEIKYIDDDGNIIENGSTIWEVRDINEDLNPGFREMFDAVEMERLYGPDGVFHTYLKQSPDYGTVGTDGGFYTYINGNFDAGTQTLKGLYYVNGTFTADTASVSINGMGSSDSDRGATIIATGKMEVESKNTPAGFKWEYFQGMMDTIPSEDDRRFPGFIFASTVDAGAACNTNSKSIRIKGKSGGGGNSSVDYKVDTPPTPSLLHGVIYAMQGGVFINGVQQSYKGAVIGFDIKYSMARGGFIHDPDLIPSTPASTSIAD